MAQRGRKMTEPASHAFLSVPVPRTHLRITTVGGIGKREHLAGDVIHCRHGILILLRSVDLWIKGCMKSCAFLLRRRACFPSPSECASTHRFIHKYLQLSIFLGQEVHEKRRGFPNFVAQHWTFHQVKSNLQPADIGWSTGNIRKLSNSQACCLSQLWLAAA